MTGVSATTSARSCGLRWLGMACMALWIGAAVASERSAHGLIVQLKDAPAHVAAQVAPANERRVAQAALDTAHDRLRRVLGSAGMTDARLRPVGRAAQLLEFGRVLGPAEAASLADRLRSRPEVAWVVPNEREQRLQVPSDPMFGSTVNSSGQWWMFPISGSNANALEDRRRGVPGLQSAWAITTGASAAAVAVLDNGITSHPDLDAHVLPGYDFVSIVEYANDGTGPDPNPSDPGDWVTQAEKDGNTLFKDCNVEDSSWHGTIIAGIVAAVTNNGVGVAGSNWNGRVLPVRVAGKCGADVADIVDGMRWAAGLEVTGVPPNANPARVINISFGGDAPCNAAYQSAIDELATLKKAVVVAAAGNERGAVRRPASCSGVVAVGALNRDGFKSTYSNFGSAITVSTVGGDAGDGGASDALLADDGLLTLHNEGLQEPGMPGYANVFGTSFAAPIASGVVSLMLSVNASLTTSQIINGLRVSARPHVTSTTIGQCSAQNSGRCICTTATCGAGILDAAQSVSYAQNPPSEEQASSGGGAFGLVWLLALGGAVTALARRREER